MNFGMHLIGCLGILFVTSLLKSVPTCINDWSVQCNDIGGNSVVCDMKFHYVLSIVSWSPLVYLFSSPGILLYCFGLME